MGDSSVDLHHPNQDIIPVRLDGDAHRLRGMPFLASAERGVKEIVLEVVLEYRPEDLRRWRGGRKVRAAETHALAHLGQQTTCQFAEHFTLDLYRKGGWCGHRFYALDGSAHDPRAVAGYADALRCFDAQSLHALAQERECAEPSLFLFRPAGEALFLEVIKGRERLSEQQLQGLARIRRALGVGVGVVYVKPHGPWYQPRQWELDLDAGCGRLLPRDREGGVSLAGLWHAAR
jgi:hypothetical protein